MIHIWHEDSKDSVTTKFWNFLKDNNVSSDLKNADIQGFDISDSKFVEQLQYISFENIATSLLSNMTNGGTTEFGITKTNFGECWHCNCCGKYKDDVGDDKCRIYKDNKTANLKAVDLWNYTEAHCYITNWG
jgi:hypothetical protein